MSKVSEIETQEIYDYFIYKFGNKTQRLQVAEECAELTYAILKQNKSKGSRNQACPKVLEEIGDVLNAIGSYLHMYGIDEEEINTNRLLKLENHYNKLKNKEIK